MSANLGEECRSEVIWGWREEVGQGRWKKSMAETPRGWYDGEKWAPKLVVNAPRVSPVRAPLVSIPHGGGARKNGTAIAGIWVSGFRVPLVRNMEVRLRFFKPRLTAAAAASRCVPQFVDV